MQFDILITAGTRIRPRQMLESLHYGALAAGVDAVVMRHYEPRRGAILVLYGLGAADRLPWARSHHERGGHFVALDAGYWDRKSEHRKFRVTVDDFHCPGLIMRGPDPGPERLRDSGIFIQGTGNPAGHIVLVGNGPKSGSCGAQGWADRKSREIRALFPGRPITYRPKRSYIEPGVVYDNIAIGDRIENVLEQASLVVCRHSNVAVDACRAGVPVVCDDGAAACIYPSRLEDKDKQPSIEKRAEFLRRLAWWQWNIPEMESGAFWRWLTGMLNEVH
jgi:hypothetical protein